MDETKREQAIDLWASLSEGERERLRSLIDDLNNPKVIIEPPPLRRR